MFEPCFFYSQLACKFAIVGINLLANHSTRAERAKEIGYKSFSEVTAGMPLSNFYHSWKEGARAINMH